MALAPNPTLIQVMLGQALLASNDPRVADEAISNLRTALTRDPDISDGYAQLAMAYGKKGDLAQADLASAQAAFTRGDLRTARQLAARAKGRFPVGTPGWVKADDIASYRTPDAERAPMTTRQGHRTMNPIKTAPDRRRGGARHRCRWPPAGARAELSPSRSSTEIEKIIRDYLIKHPEVLQEAMAELEKRQQTAETEKARAAVEEQRRRRCSIRRAMSWSATPQGDVTLVEFFDYNCGYCKRALIDLVELMKDDPKLRVVLKEFPVLGPGSVEAAQVGVAVRMQDKTGKKYLDFHQKLLSGRGQVDKARALAAAKEVGLDMARLEKDLASEEVRASLEESFKLAEALGLNGTPSYVIGNDVVIGAVGAATCRKALNAQVSGTLQPLRANADGDQLTVSAGAAVARLRLT